MISIPDPARGPLTVPIWYDCEPGGALWVITDRTSRKGELREAGGSVVVRMRPERWLSVDCQKQFQV